MYRFKSIPFFFFFSLSMQAGVADVLLTLSQVSLVAKYGAITGRFFYAAVNADAHIASVENEMRSHYKAPSSAVEKFIREIIKEHDPQLAATIVLRIAQKNSGWAVMNKSVLLLKQTDIAKLEYILHLPPSKKLTAEGEQFIRFIKMVIAHEVGHIKQQTYKQRMYQSALTYTGACVMSFRLLKDVQRSMPSHSSAKLLMAVSTISFFDLPEMLTLYSYFFFSRMKEYDADRYACTRAQSFDDIDALIHFFLDSKARDKCYLDENGAKRYPLIYSVYRHAKTEKKFSDWLENKPLLYRFIHALNFESHPLVDDRIAYAKKIQWMRFKKTLYDPQKNTEVK